MADVKRVICMEGDCGIYESSEGDLVYYADYLALAAECEALRSALEEIANRSYPHSLDTLEINYRCAVETAREALASPASATTGTDHG